jgi:hypothetical protein
MSTSLPWPQHADREFAAHKALTLLTVDLSAIQRGKLKQIASGRKEKVRDL